MALGTATQKIESAVIAVVLGLSFPFIITYRVSTGRWNATGSQEMARPKPTAQRWSIV